MDIIMVEDFFDKNFFIIFKVLLVSLFIYIFVEIFRGREFSIWPPRIGQRRLDRQKSKTSKKEHEELKFALVIIFSSIFSIILFFLHTFNELLFKLTEKDWPNVFYLIEESQKLGEALFIAIFLAVTVDIYVKKRLASEVAKDVAKYIPGHNLPEEIRNELYNIYSLGQYRSVSLDVTLEEIEGFPDIVSVIMDMKYVLTNLTGGLLKHEHKVSVEPSKKQNEDHIHHIIQRMSGKNVFSCENNNHAEDYDEKASSSHPLGAIDKNNYSTWSKTIYVPPHDKSTFQTKVYYTLPIDHQEPIISLYATIDAEITAKYQKGIDVNVIIGHRDALNIDPIDIDEGGTVPSKGMSKTWLFKGYALLPYQPIIIKWARKK